MRQRDERVVIRSMGADARLILVGIASPSSVDMVD